MAEDKEKQTAIVIYVLGRASSSDPSEELQEEKIK